MHEKLLDARKDATDFINIYVISCYGIIGLVLLYVSGYVIKVSFGGADLDLTKGYMLEYAAGLVCLAFVLIGFHLLRLARIFRAIRLNGSEISRINPAAKIVGVDDMQFYVGRYCGLMLAFARIQTRVIMRNIQSIPIERLLDAVTLFRKEASLKALSRLAGSTATLAIAFGQFTPLLLFRTALATLVVYLPLVFPVVAIFYVKYRLLVTAQPTEIVAALQYYLRQVDPMDESLLVASIFVTAGTLLASSLLALSYSRDLVIAFLEPMNLSIGEFANQLSGPEAEGVQQLRSKLDAWWQHLA